MRVVIVGGGIGGLTSALIFKKIGFNVKLLEATAGRFSSSDYNNPLYTALWNPTFQILKHCDLYREIEKHLKPVNRIKLQNLDGSLLAQSSLLKPPPGFLLPRPPVNCSSFTEAPSLGFINDHLLLQTLYHVLHSSLATSHGLLS
jgi:2-polyprenyl-6-methoxyphenol hydroxylase-like FAD-dependent oxidoreductase